MIHKSYKSFLPIPGYGIVGYACCSAACAASPLGIPVAIKKIQYQRMNGGMLYLNLQLPQRDHSYIHHINYNIW